MDERQQRGLEIAALSKITKRGNETWIVPSQSMNGKYAVTITEEGKACTCPDFELRQQPCKHVFAVQYVLFREQVTETKPDGTVTTTTTEAAKVRVTYKQDWSTYNKAQTTEKDHFCRLLGDLVADVPTPEQKGAGNRRMSMADAIFAATYKTYSGFSGRRFMSDLRAAREEGLIDKAICYNAIFKIMQSEELTPILQDLITATARPLASLETQYAVDSTGIGTQSFYRHYSAKYGHDQMNHDNVKLHVLIGTKTNVVVAATVTDRDGGDSPQFAPLVEDAARNFEMKEISADKAYSSKRNVELAEAVGAKVFIPFKKNATGAIGDVSNRKSKVWTRLFHYFHMNREEFLGHYHRRSNVETTFSMIKRCVGDTLRSKHPVAQVNEVLLMVICHNIRVLIHEAFEMGFTPMLEAACPPVLAGAHGCPAQ